MKISIAMLVLVFVSSIQAQDSRIAPVSQTPLGLLPHLDEGDDPDIRVRFDHGMIRAETIGTFRNGNPAIDLVIEGRDRAGKRWQVRTAFVGGLGFSEGWQADLDGDGTRDLILVHFLARMGRCSSVKRLTTVSFDADGKPVPWEMEGHFEVETKSDGGRGVLNLLDLDQDGRSEFVQVDCDYDNYEATAAYTASDAGWSLLTRSKVGRLLHLYEQTAGKQRSERARAEVDGFTPDYSTSFAGSPQLTIGEIVPREPRRPIANPPVRGNRIIEGAEYEAWAKNERDVTADRWLLSDGTECYGLPSIIIDRPQGRLAVLASTGRTSELLRQIIRDKWPIALAGRTEGGRCSPAWVWAREPQ